MRFIIKKKNMIKKLVFLCVIRLYLTSISTTNTLIVIFNHSQSINLKIIIFT